jgi:hypothetical protein
MDWDYLIGHWHLEGDLRLEPRRKRIRIQMSSMVDSHRLCVVKGVPAAEKLTLDSMHICMNVLVCEPLRIVVL